MAGWYIRRGEKIVGPVDLAKVRELAAQNRLQPSDHLATNVAGPWQQADALGLFKGKVVKPRTQVATEVAASKYSQNVAPDWETDQQQHVSNATLQFSDEYPPPSPVSDAGVKLIACPDCNRQISRLASTCPNCGRPMLAVSLPVAAQPVSINQVVVTRRQGGKYEAVGFVTILIGMALCYINFGLAAIVIGVGFFIFLIGRFM